MKVLLEPGPIDAALSIDQPGVEYVQKPGEYRTLGPWAYGDRWQRMLFGGGTSLRVDNGRAALALDDRAVRSLDGQPRPEEDLWVLTAGPDCSIAGIEIDGRQKAFPDRFIKAGIRWSGRLTATDCKVRGLRGRYENRAKNLVGVEAFGFSIFGGLGSSDLTSCEVVDCAENAYVTSFNVGCVDDDSFGVSTLKSCKSNPGAGNWAGFGVNRRVLIQYCEAIGTKYAVYNDTGPTGDARFEEFTARDVTTFVSLIQQQVGLAEKYGVTFIEPEIQLTADLNGEARLIEVWNQVGDAAPRTGGVVIYQPDLTVKASKLWLWATAGRTEPVAVIGGRVPAGHSVGAGIRV